MRRDREKRLNRQQFAADPPSLMVSHLIGGSSRRRVQGRRGGAQTWRKLDQASQCGRVVARQAWRCLPGGRVNASAWAWDANIFQNFLSLTSNSACLLCL